MSNNSTFEQKPYPSNPLCSNLCLGLICLALVLGAAPMLVQKFALSNAKAATTIKNCTVINKFAIKYPQQNKLFWRTIKVNVDHVLRDEPPQPAVIVFVYDGKDSIAIQKMINQLSEVIHSCFDTQARPLLLSSKDFNKPDMIKDYGVAISTYREQLEKSVVMFVHGIQDISGKVIEAFHTFCDKQTPLVKQSLIFFSLELKNSKKIKSINELNEKVEDELTEMWKKYVPHNKIQPLLSRMTETILYLDV